MNFKICITGIITAVYFSSQTFAVCPDPSTSTIKTLDFSEQAGPIKDQDTIGWCYAYTSADLLNQYIYKKKNLSKWNVDETVSPISLAILYNKKKNEKGSSCNIVTVKSKHQLINIDGEKHNHFIEEGGIPCDTTNLAFKNKFCYEKEMRSHNYEHVDGLKCLAEDKCKLADIIDRLANPENQEYSCIDYRAIMAIVPTSFSDKILKIIEQTSRNNLLDNINDKICTQTIPGPQMPTAKSEYVPFSKVPYDETKKRYLLEQFNQSLFKSIDKKLEEGKMISISYYPNFLNTINPSHKKITSLETHSPPKKKESAGTHASTVVGRRVNPKTCQLEYKIKNSWGTGCNQYMHDPQIELTQCISQAEQRRFKENITLECASFLSYPNFDFQDQAAIKKEKECSVYLLKESDKKAMIELCKKTHVKYQINDKITCEEPGYVYIPQSELQNHLYSIHYIDD